MVKKVERIDESGGVHAMWSPSSSNRWLECPLSVIQSQALPQPKSSGAATEGTIAHSWGEKILLGERTPDEMEDDTMRAGVEIYTDYVEKIFDQYEDPGYEVEGMITLDQLIPGGSPSYWSCFGSSDFSVYDEADKTMPEVIDFKYGRHPVEAKNNTQLGLYGIGFCDDIGYKGKIKLTIVQPRAHHVDGPVRTWIATAKELNDLRIRARKVLTNAHGSKKKAGDWCHYCLLAPTCEAKNKQIQTLASVEFGTVDFRPMIPDSMNDKQIAAIVEHHKAIAKWMESVVAHARKEAMHGNEIAHTKLVRNAGRNGWTDDKAFNKMVKNLGIENAYKTSNKGIGDIKKIVKEMYEDNPDDLLAEYITKFEGGISLVSENDGRPAYNSAALDFAGK